MMEVSLNGQARLFKNVSTLNDLVSQLELSGKFAVELNQNIIPRSEYAETPVHAGDKIEIVEAIGGG
jgi:sulfur carrier protein